MTPNENDKKGTPATKDSAAPKAAKPYVKPRIITHSQADLEKTALKVNACTSDV